MSARSIAPTAQLIGPAERAGASLCVVLLALPYLLPLPTVPDTVLSNQLIAVGAWAVWILTASARGRTTEPADAPGPAAMALGSICLCGAAALFARASHSRGAAMVIAAAVAVLAAASMAPRRSAAVVVARALSLAGVLSCLVAFVQVLAPDVSLGRWIVSDGGLGRAVGNMRQPNHLATALLCAMVWTAWLWQAGRRAPHWAGAALIAMAIAVTLSASRTGALSLGVLALWAWADRSLPRAARWTLGIAPLICAVSWAALVAWAELEHGNFYAAERLQSGSDPSSSRFAIWHDALVLLAQQPWTGVGWGNFNFAWTFTPLPNRPVAFFDHTHNLPLQLAVELGLPAALLVLGVLAWTVWHARAAWHRVQRDPAHPARAALVMLAVLGVHSLLEYPLWYPYFLLPAAWALGLVVGAVPVTDAVSRRGQRWWSVPILRVAAALMLAGAAYAAWDHRRIEAIFAPPAGAAPLSERIADGRHSVLFGHHADYAAVTSEPRDGRLDSFRRPLHQLVDVRLLIAYMEALRANGRMAEALYAAQRLREFRRDDAQAYFKDCGADNPTPPFQCDTRPVELTWRDLEP